jgi:hypothetical protein
MARIYTCMGKENVVCVDSHMIRDGHLIIQSDVKEVERIKNMIDTGAPCCLKVDYEADIYIDMYSEFSGCRLCKCGEIIYEKDKTTTSIKTSGRAI